MQSDFTQVQLLSACPVSGRKSAADGRAWNSEAAGASPAVLTNFESVAQPGLERVPRAHEIAGSNPAIPTINSCEAHADEHRPDKSKVAGANRAAATNHAGAHGARHRCQRGTGRFDSVRPLQFAPADGPVDGLLSRRCWFESNSGRHTRADRNGGDLLSRQHVSSSLTAGAAKLTGISIPG